MKKNFFKCSSSTQLLLPCTQANITLLREKQPSVLGILDLINQMYVNYTSTSIVDSSTSLSYMGGPGVPAQWLKFAPYTYQDPIQVPVHDPVALLPIQLPACDLEKQSRTTQSLEILHPRGRPERGSGLLAWNRRISSHCGYLESESSDRRCSSLSLLLSVYLT